MASRKPDLQKIVSLKRQKAEQDFHLAKQDRDRAGAEAAHLEESLRILDGQRGEAETFLLSLKNGRVSKLIQDIELVRATVTEKESVLRSAHDVLKRAFDSEDRLKNMTK
jgi:hypothetical protein